MFLPPQSLFIEALTPNMIVFRGGTFKNSLGLEKVGPHDRFCLHKKKKRLEFALSPPFEDTLRR